MATVYCGVALIDVENEDGRMVPGTIVTCGDCGHETQSFGQSDRSIKRCLVLLREECPQGESNFYEED